MTTNSNQDREFLNDVCGSDMLERAIAFVKANFSPDEIFSEEEIFSVARNYDPDGIFDEDALSSWADRNGYVKSEN